VKWMLEQKLVERAKALEPVMMEEINALVERHPSVKAGRAIGLFGCLDLQGPDGRAVQELGRPFTPPVQTLKAALTRNGIMGIFRPPLLHCTPPLVITEDELRDGFRRVSRSLAEMDAAM
jgi:taurine--2-oxoglutarate transaminase